MSDGNYIDVDCVSCGAPDRCVPWVHRGEPHRCAECVVASIASDVQNVFDASTYKRKAEEDLPSD